MWIVLVPPPSMSHYWLQIFCITLLALCFAHSRAFTWDTMSSGILGCL